jgi:hypothetical protein
MSYKSWFEEHAKKHTSLVDKLRVEGLNDEALLDYFEFENMALKEVDFCPLYVQKKKCHDMEYLNCFLCACPHFRFCDEGLHVKSDGVVIKSKCAINSRFASEFVYENVAHLDCSNCTIPHTKEFVKKHTQIPWREIMAKCIVGFEIKH